MRCEPRCRNHSVIGRVGSDLFEPQSELRRSQKPEQNFPTGTPQTRLNRSDHPIADVDQVGQLLLPQVGLHPLELEPLSQVLPVDLDGGIPILLSILTNARERLVQKQQALMDRCTLCLVFRQPLRTPDRLRDLPPEIVCRLHGTITKTVAS